jgi:proliferating cell nuclear antigen
MDSSHVSLCALHFEIEAFERFHCDKPISLGLNTPSLSKVLKCASYDDTVTLRGDESSGYLTLIFEAPNRLKKSEFELMLMDIESEHLSIPPTEYDCRVRMPSAEFQRIIRDLKELSGSLGDACKMTAKRSFCHFIMLIEKKLLFATHERLTTGTISIEKGLIRFSSSGALGTGSIILQHNTQVDNKEDAVVVVAHQPVEHSFAVRYLSLFTKATPLGPTVTLHLSPDAPMSKSLALIMIRERSQYNSLDDAMRMNTNTQEKTESKPILTANTHSFALVLLLLVAS